ncbi:hypothetical protein BGZ58_005669, partial [Dissophora ornata]
ATDDRDGHQGPDLSEPINVDDLFRLFQMISNPRAMQQQQFEQQSQQQHQQQQGMPGHAYSTEFQITFNSGPTGSTRTFTTMSPGIGGGMVNRRPQEEEVKAKVQAIQQAVLDRRNGTVLMVIYQGKIFILLNRLLGIELHYTTDPAALGHGFGGPMGNPLSGLLPIVGNPGDYAWGQGGLDDIITRMMELQ